MPVFARSDPRPPLVSRPPTVFVRSTSENVGTWDGLYLVYIPGSDPDTIVNWANTWTTQGGAANANVPVAGVKPLSTSNLGLNGGRMVGDIYDPASIYSLTVAGSAFFTLPSASTGVAPTSPGLRYTHKDVAVYLEHQQGRHLFFEFAAHHADTSKVSEYIMARTIMDARIDVNQTLPTGGPNPNFLQPYGDAANSHQYFDNTYDEVRGAVAIVFDKTRWGSFRGNLIVGDSRQEAPTYRIADVLNRNPDIRLRSRDDQFTYRFYWNSPAPLTLPDSIQVVNPIAGTTNSYQIGRIVDLNSTTNNRQADTDYTYLQAAFNAQLFDDRLNLLVGARRDSYTTESWSVNSSAAALFNDYPLDWDGRTLIWRPAAPADYWNLTYVPKSTAGVATGPATPALTRPRTNGVPQPQYANDRFRDDYSSPPVDFNISTVTYGGVFHVQPWVSVYANYAESFNPPTSGLTLTGASVPPGFSDGTDFGLRFNLLEGRIVASVGRYESTQRNNTLESSGSTRKYANIVAANVVGDQSPNGMNNRGLALIPTPTFDFQDREASGYELDVVANITSQWRLTLNYSDPEVFTSNSRQDEWAYLNANEATLKQIVLDAGGLIDINNVATVDTSVPVDARSPDVAAAVTGWNDIQTFKRTNDPTVESFSNLPDFTANIYTDYRFSTGFLKSVRVGGGVQFLGRRAIGNRGADTIVDPSDPTRAIDDPDVGASTRVYMPSTYTTTATIGYRRQLNERLSLELNLSIRNVLDDRDPIYSSALRPPGGDLSRPDRVATRIAFLNRDPRSFTLSARLGF